MFDTTKLILKPIARFLFQSRVVWQGGRVIKHSFLRKCSGNKEFEIVPKRKIDNPSVKENDELG